MALVSIVDTIDFLIDQQQTDKKFCAILDMIKIKTSFILEEETQFSYDEEKYLALLVDAIIYIEGLKVQGYLWNSSFHSSKRSAKKEVLSEKEPGTKDAFLVLNANQYDIINYFHTRLFNYYQYLIKNNENIAWNFFYPPTDVKDRGNLKPVLKQQEIMSPGIKTWQEALRSPSNNITGSILDFQRGYGLTGKNQKEKPPTEEIEQLIDNLVDKTTYAEDEKVLLKKWLRENGGQINNGLMKFLIQQHEFTDDECSDTRSELIEGYWRVVNGKLVLELDIATYCILDANTQKLWLIPSSAELVKQIKSLGIKSENELPNEKCCQLTVEEGEKLGIKKIDSKQLNALIRTKAQYEIAIFINQDNKKCIEPIVKQLSVTSYTHNLNIPFTKQSPVNVRNQVNSHGPRGYKY